MGRGFWVVCVVPLIVACGGVEIGATRHVDGEPRVGDAAPPPTLPGGDAGMITAGGESGAPLADAGVRTLTCRTLRPDVLSGSNFANPDVTGIHFSSDAKTAYGIASWDDKRSLWKAQLGPDGMVSTTDLVTDANLHATGFVYVPRTVTVRSVPRMGDVLALSGLPPPSYSQFSYLWFARAALPDSEWSKVNANGSYTDATRVIGDFALAADRSYVYLTGVPDAYGNLYATLESAGSTTLESGPFQGTASVPVAYSLAIAQVSEILAVSYRTALRDRDSELSPTNPRISDHLDQIDFVHGTTNWTLPLAMRRLAQLRVDSAGNTFVIGVLQDGDALDVRKISATGVTEWAVAPPPFGIPVESIVPYVAPDGEIVVGWNLGETPGGPGRVAVQTFSRDGTSCTTHLVAGTATDVAVLADGSILVAMDDAISRVAP